MEDLLTLEAQRLLPAPSVPPMLQSPSTPLDWRMWEECLKDHPDRRFRDYIVRGIRDGFRIGFSRRSHRCRRAKKNMRSALEHPGVIQDYLMKGCVEGHILGPFDPHLLPDVQISRFGVIPKGNSGKWRLILDLSSPEGSSVNDGIEPDLCSLSYLSMDQVVEAIARLGRGAVLAKVDIKSAYRMVPVHPEDRPLLGMMWDGALYVDGALPFGLRSAPKIFTAVADAVEWLVRQKGVQWLGHYLDDFLILGSPDSDECAIGLRILLDIFRKLDIPMALEKLEGPALKLPFLGIELDTRSLTLRLPPGKLCELKALVATWLGRKSCTRKDLQSLAGKLQHACKVIKPGRVFLRRIFNLLKGTPLRRRTIRLTTSFRSDVAWWHIFLDKWNGISMISPPPSQATDIHLYSDASGSFGCGAWWGVEWLRYLWQESWIHQSIAAKELLPIVMAGMLWGRHWRRRRVIVHCDNLAVVGVVNSGAAKDPELAQLLRCLFFVKAHFNLVITAVHIPGVLNKQADAISRNNLSSFFSQVPGASRNPTFIPPAMIQLLVTQKPDWTSPAWFQLFVSCLQPV